MLTPQHQTMRFTTMYCPEWFSYVHSDSQTGELYLTRSQLFDLLATVMVFGDDDCRSWTRYMNKIDKTEKVAKVQDFVFAFEVNLYSPSQVMRMVKRFSPELVDTLASEGLRSRLESRLAK